jgi:hypothetical protein
MAQRVLTQSLGSLGIKIAEVIHRIPAMVNKYTISKV